MTLNSINHGYLLLKETPINHLLVMDDMNCILYELHCIKLYDCTNYSHWNIQFG